MSFAWSQSVSDSGLATVLAHTPHSVLNMKASCAYPVVSRHEDTPFKDALNLRTTKLGTNHCILTALLLPGRQCSICLNFLGKQCSRYKEILLHQILISCQSTLRLCHAEWTQCLTLVDAVWSCGRVPQYLLVVWLH